jgi:ABC-2 type transport system ATP-binding protein
VIFLDEPTLGLDPSSREIMWKYIDRLVKDEKITLILTTHYMEEADFLCDRIGIIDKGMIIALDSPAQLKESLGGEVIEIELMNKQHLNKDVIEYILKPYDFVHKVELDGKNGNVLIYVKDASRNLPTILKALDRNNSNNAVKSVEFRSPTLNDVFLKLAGRHIMKQQELEEVDSEGGFMEKYAQYGNK